jgi:uncharacterized protein (TIRG00374 family)
MNILNSKIFKLAAKTCISLLFVAWLVFKVRWHEVLGYAQLLSVSEILLYLLVVIAGMLISARKWQMLLENKNFQVSLRELFVLYLTGSFINNFMPSTIGGDTYRAYQVGKENKDYAKSAATVVMDRVTGLLGLMLLTSLLLVLNWQEVTKHELLSLLMLGGVGILIALFLAEKSRHFAWGQKMIAKVPLKIREFVQSLHAFYLHRKLFGSALGFSMLFALVGVALANYLLFWALGVHVGILNYLSVIFLVSIVSALPVSINNIGIKEWAYVTLFGLFGVSSSAVVAVALISRFLQMLLSFAALPFYLKGKEALRR